MPTNMMQFINMVKGGNPQQIAMNMLAEKAKQGNPLFTNLLQLAQNGNTQDIEAIARNMARERGIDFDKDFNIFKQMFGDFK